MDLKIIYIILVLFLLIGIITNNIIKNKLAKLISCIVICISIIIGCVVSIKPVINSTNYGLDLQGGFEVLYQISPIKKKVNK